MAEAIFYDRKHGCEVKASEICHINFVHTIARTKSDEDLRKGKKRKITSAYEWRLGELGYKSPDCRQRINWDRWLMYTDLVFVRFE
jgi:hypothetical protein